MSDSEKDKFNWIAMVEHFSDLCREFEECVQRKDASEDWPVFYQLICNYASYYDEVKLKYRAELFGKSYNWYDAQNLYEQDWKEKPKLTLSSLIEQVNMESAMKDDAMGSDLSPDNEIKNLNRAIGLRKKHLNTFFGLEFKEAKTEAQKYQVLQLLLILFRCEQETKQGILDEIKESSFWRFRTEVGNPYQNAIGFIRSELLKGLSFKEAAIIERFAGQIRFGIHNTAEAIVNRVINAKRLGALIVDNEIRCDLQQIILSNLRELNKTKESEVLEKEMADFFWRAYLRFLLLGVTDSIMTPYLGLHPEELWEDKPTLFTVAELESRVEQRKTSEMAKKRGYKEALTSSNIALDEIESLINDEVEFIAVRVLGKLDAKIRRTIRRYNNEYRIYLKLARLYCDYHGMSISRGISINELLGSIFLFHECEKREKGSFCLTSREGSYYGGKNRRKEKQIKSIINDLDITLDYKVVFGDREERWYELASFMNTLDSMLKNETNEMLENRREISKEMLIYLKRIVPLLEEVPRKYNDLTEIAESIVSKHTLEQYCRWKEKKKGIKLFVLD